MKKRLLIVAENLYGGGVERILQIVLRNFDFSRYEITLYSSRKETLLPEFYPTHIKQGYFFESISEKASLKDRLVCRIINKFKLFVYYNFSPSVFYRFFVKGKYDVGIAFIEGYATRILSGGPEKMKKIAWVHTDIQTNHWTKIAFRSFLEETHCYSLFDTVACVSQCVAEQYYKTFNTNNHIVLYNPIDRERIIKKASVKVLDITAVNLGMISILSLGRLEPIKGYMRLLRVVARLHNEDKLKPVLFVLGEGKEKEILYNFIISHHMESYVHLLGFKDNPYPYLAQTDIYVCSSIAEGYNTAITEALVLGKAVVTTDVSGAREQLGNSEYGIVTDNDENSLYQGLKRMMCTEVLQYYTEKAQQRVKIYGVDTSMAHIYQLIES